MSSISTSKTESLDLRRARRLALAVAGFLKPEWVAQPTRAKGRGLRARRAALATIRRFGYLQLDTVSIAGARSHAIVLLSRIAGLDRHFPEELLGRTAPGDEPALFEGWGHEASWMPLELYPAFEFRREAMRHHRWVGPVLDEHRETADELVRRIADEGPLRSVDMEGSGAGEWWGFKLSKRVANCLWFVGELAIAERNRFQRTYDLPERVLPRSTLAARLSLTESLKLLLGHALDGHGWASVGTLADTFRLRNLRAEITQALDELLEEGQIARCELRTRDRALDGFVRPGHLELAERLHLTRPRLEDARLLSPFDPLIWDRPRTQLLFDFEQVLEIFKPAPQRKYGYYCLPVLAGERLVGRVDLKAERREGRLQVLSRHLEDPDRLWRGQRGRRPTVADLERLVGAATERFAHSVDLEVAW